ncbi:unnamed protein product [Musa acuminata var. zebrina]
MKPTSPPSSQESIPLYSTRKGQSKWKLQREEAGAAIVEVERIAEGVVVEAETLLALPSFAQLPPYLRPELPVEALEPPLSRTQYRSGLSQNCHHSDGHSHLHRHLTECQRRKTF